MSICPLSLIYLIFVKEAHSSPPFSCSVEIKPIASRFLYIELFIKYNLFLLLYGVLFFVFLPVDFGVFGDYFTSVKLSVTVIFVTALCLYL